MNKPRVPELLQHLTDVAKKDYELSSPRAQLILYDLEECGVRELYYILIRRKGYSPYIKFCTNLGRMGVQAGLFNHHIHVKDLRIRIVDQTLDWKTILRHLPCTRDLTWEK